MANDAQTLQAAKDYTDAALRTHLEAIDPHPQYLDVRGADGQPVTGFIIYRLAAGDPFPPVTANAVVFAPTGMYMPNETSTAWVNPALGPIPSDTTPPTVPGNFRATTITATSISVAWNASTDTDTGISGYDVSINSGAWIPLGNVLAYTFSSLASNTSYAFKVRARDNATTPNASAAATVAATTSTVSVSAPRNLRTTAITTTSITFAWDAPTSGTINHYEWRVAGGTFASNGTATTKQITGLTAGTPYVFGVRAIFADSTTSAEVTLTATTTGGGGGGGTGTMYIGIHAVAPTSGDISANPPLSIYSGLSQLQVANKIEADMQALTGFSGPLMTMGHAYMAVGSGYNLSSWASQQMPLFPGMSLNFKPNGGESVSGFAATSSGADDNAIKAMIASLPVGKRIYLTYDHEPADPINGAPTDAFMAGWRAAQVRWAQLIIANRGAKDLHPTLCLTTYSFRPAAASQQAKYLSVTSDYAAAGINWQTQVVFGADGYQQKVTGPNPTGTVKLVNSSATNTYVDIYPQLQAAGWIRLGITETACCDRVGTSGPFSITSTDVTQAPVWTKSLVKYAAQYNMEYVLWFNATGSMGPLGTWMFTDAVKAAWGTAGHYKGPAPGW